MSAASEQALHSCKTNPVLPQTEDTAEASPDAEATDIEVDPARPHLLIFQSGVASPQLQLLLQGTATYISCTGI